MSTSSTKLSKDNLRCQPCTELNKSSTAISWCLDCELYLCKSCSAYHYALRATRDHKLIPKQAYETIKPYLLSLETYCSEHVGNTLSHYCTTHNTACCLDCKCKYHGKCSLVTDIGDVVAQEKQMNCYHELLSELTNITECLLNHTELNENNISRLNVQKELLYNDLAWKRNQVDKALDKIESDIKIEIEKKFDAEKSKILKRQAECKLRIETLRKGKNVVSVLTEIGVKDSRFFLIYQTVHEKLLIANLSKPGYLHTQIKSTSTIYNEINENDKSVHLSGTVSFIEIPYRLEHEKPEDIIDCMETASSTVEDEITSDEKNRETNTKPIQTEHLLKETFRLSHLRDLPSPYGPRFVKFISEKLFVVGGSSYIVFYTTHSYKRVGEVHFQFNPTSVDAINDKQIILTCHMAVVFVDTKYFKVEKKILMNDTCNVVVVMKGTLVVSCKSRGVVVMTMEGKYIKSFRDITGVIHMCRVNDDLVAAVFHSDSIALLNTETGAIKEHIVVSPSFCINWISSDKNGNIFMTGAVDNQVYILHTEKRNCIALFGINTELKGAHPLSGMDISVETQTIFIVGDNGRSLFVFSGNYHL